MRKHSKDIAHAGGDITRELDSLVRSAQARPGFAELIRLYTEHAAIVEQARAYGPRASLPIVSSSDTTA